MPLDKKITIAELLRRKKAGEKFAMLTSYDATTAHWQEQAGVESLLVGDSMGNVILGQDSTVGVSLDLSVTLTAAVRRGAPHVYLVGDMPFLSYHADDPGLAIAHAGRYLVEAQADAVKLEVDARHVELVAAMSAAGIPVMAHLGLSPQRVAQMGGMRVHARTAASAAELVETAQRMEQAGAVAVLIEATPPEPARLVTERLAVPVIGCGAGPFCDGFVLIVHDILGLTPGHTPQFAQRYVDLSATMTEAFRAYVADVHGGGYPATGHNYAMREGQAEQLDDWARGQS